MTSSNAPAGVNAPATPIVWTTRQLAGPGIGSVTLSTAQAGPYALEVHDTIGDRGRMRIVLWSVGKDGKRLEEGVLDTTEDGKAAAETEVRRLLTEAGEPSYAIADHSCAANRHP